MKLTYLIFFFTFLVCLGSSCLIQGDEDSFSYFLSRVLWFIFMTIMDLKIVLWVLWCKNPGFFVYGHIIVIAFIVKKIILLLNWLGILVKTQLTIMQGFVSQCNCTPSTYRSVLRLNYGSFVISLWKQEISVIQYFFYFPRFLAIYDPLLSLR